MYLQPKDRERDSRYLSNAGNDKFSGMSWDYFQFGTMIASKCESEGIAYGKKPKSKASAGGVRRVRKASKSNGKSGKKPIAAGV